ncbi:MAG: response regulator [Firmicutes bacterium]|nr:response regulator [Bacillota bacterium]
MKVLICDDSLLIRRQLKDALEKMGGFEIHQAANGKEALDVYNRVSPHMVLLDLVMPVMNGLECLKKIKDADKRANVVMITSTGTKENLRKALDLGALDFIQKPWKEEQLISALSRIKGRC